MSQFSSGMPIVGRIRGHDLVGTIHVSESGRMWFCHDHGTLDGTESPDRHGHRYSWVFDHHPGGGFTCDVEYVLPLREYRKMDVEPELAVFIDHFCGPGIIGMLNAKIKPFADFNRIEFGKEPGTVKLTGSVTTKMGTFDKSVSIKVSRFLRRLVDSYAEFVNRQNVPSTTSVSSTISDSKLESIYNKCVALHSGELFRLEVLKGDDIKEGYTRDNYSPVKRGTLRKSCMTDKLSCLGLYTDNPQVSLACLRSDAGIEARCLLWESDGRKFYDRIYFTDEWMSAILERKLRELSYERPVPESVTTIRLDKVRFRKYPYVDTFFYVSTEDRTVSFTELPRRLLPRGEYRVLRNVDGTHGNIEIDQG